VYSTCSDDVKQNEEVVLALLQHPTARGAALLDPVPATAVLLPPVAAEVDLGVEIDVFELLKRPLSDIYAYYKQLTAEERKHLSTVVCRQVCRQACVPIEMTQLVNDKSEEGKEAHSFTQAQAGIGAIHGKVGKLSYHGGTSGLFIAAIQKPLRQYA